MTGQDEERRARYFDGREFVPPRLAEQIARLVELRKGFDKELWVKDREIWRPWGDTAVEWHVKDFLREKFRRRHLAEVLAYLKAGPVELDGSAPPENRLPVANGFLDLDDLTLRESPSGEAFFHRLPVAWVPGAECPAIDAFLSEVLPADAVGFFWEAIGMSLVPTQRFRRAVMLIGPGGNGKSVALKVWKALLGHENVSSVTLQELSEDKFAKAELVGKLANIAGDLDARPVAKSEAFKTITGGDLITAERKYGQKFRFEPYATLVFSANEWPATHDQTEAFFTRWVALPFSATFREGSADLGPGERRADPKLGDRLTRRSELEGALVKAVRGAIRLRERGGFDLPRSVRESVQEYRQWADTVMAWTAEEVSPSPNGQVSRKLVYTTYKEWADAMGMRPVSAKKFWPRFRELLERDGGDLEEVTVQGERRVTGVTVGRLGENLGGNRLTRMIERD